MRSIDHLVFVTENLSGARKRYQKMGFNVAPDGIHPFGTYNANMYFRDGLMIETLSIENYTKYSKAITTGNTFVKNDGEFRAVHGNEGFSHIVITSNNADLDRNVFLQNGINGGDVVSFSRQFKQPDGSVGTVAAKLAFATHPKAGGGYYFTCEDVVVPTIDHSLLLDHENGAMGVKCVISCSRKPLTYINFLKVLFGPSMVSISGPNIECSTLNGCISVVAPEVLTQEYGITHSKSRMGLLHRGIIFDVNDLQKTKALFMQNKIHFEHHGARLIIQHPTELITFFAFEQHS